MKKIKTNLLDCYILEPQRFGDERGYFESITKEQLEELGFKQTYQISNSKSEKGTIRGLHYQKNPYCQAKVVRCHRGAVLDVVVDMREDSPSYGQSIAVELTPENGRCLFVPRGFAHAYLALKNDSLFEYYVDNKYMPRMEGGILWNDPSLKINWKEIFKKYDIKNPIISDKDKVRNTLTESRDKFYRKPIKFLITGFKGQLGFDIVRELRARGENEYLALDIDDLDITNRELVMKTIKEYKPDVIFHCAAWTDVDKAEEMEEQVRKVNVEGTKNLTDASIEVGAKIIYTSTDYVFDGNKKGLYTEEDIPNPKNIYGQTKIEGEEEIKRNIKHFICRISWVFGINGNNFVKTILKLSETKEKLNVVNDQIGSPTYTVDLAKLLIEMSFTEEYGIYNINNNGYCSWAEFAKYIIDSNGKNTKINPVTTDEYLKICGKKQAYRPRNSKLDKNKLIEKGFEMLPSWQDATDRYCKELKNKK